MVFIIVQRFVIGFGISLLMKLLIICIVLSEGGKGSMVRIGGEKSNLLWLGGTFGIECSEARSFLL